MLEGKAVFVQSDGGRTFNESEKGMHKESELNEIKRGMHKGNHI